MKNIIGQERVFLKEIKSTNKYARDLIKNEKIKNGTIIITDFQTEGIGHSGSKWESNPNQNLLLSIILIPEKFQVENHFYLSKFISISICNFLRSYSEDVFIKWPNDIIFRNKKICGILIENIIEQTYIKNSIIGIGININQTDFPGALNATSLSLETKEKFELNTLLNNLCDFINYEYSRIIEGSFQQIDKEYFYFLFKANTWSKYRKQGQLFEAKITGISIYGELEMITRDNQQLRFGFKEVEFIF